MRDMDVQDGAVTALMRDGVPDPGPCRSCDTCTWWVCEDMGDVGICEMRWRRMLGRDVRSAARCCKWANDGEECFDWEECE